MDERKVSIGTIVNVFSILAIGIGIGVVIILVLSSMGVRFKGLSVFGADVELPTAVSPVQVLVQQPATQLQQQPQAQQPQVQAQPQQPASASSAVCKEAGGASGFTLSNSQPPSAPTNGCVLIAEWWVPPDSQNCGIIITTKDPVLPNGVAGSWWYVYPTRPDSHKQEYLAKNPQCKVEDLR